MFRGHCILNGVEFNRGGVSENDRGCEIKRGLSGCNIYVMRSILGIYFVSKKSKVC